MTDLRRSVLWAIAQGTRITDQDLADLAGIEVVTCRQYAGHLVRQGVLRRSEGGYLPGPKWDEWRRTEPKTRSGGNSKAYRLAKEARDRIRKRAWEERGGGSLTCDRATRPNTEASDPTMALSKTLARSVAMLTLGEVASILNVHENTVRNLVKAGKLKPVRLSPSLVRYPASDVQRLAAGG